MKMVFIWCMDFWVKIRDDEWLVITITLTNDIHLWNGRVMWESNGISWEDYNQFDLLNHSLKSGYYCGEVHFWIENRQFIWLELLNRLNRMQSQVKQKQIEGNVVTAQSNLFKWRKSRFNEWFYIENSCFEKLYLNLYLKLGKYVFLFC